MTQYLSKLKFYLLIYLLVLCDDAFSTAHPQMLGGDGNDIDPSALGDLSFVAMRINGVMRLLESPRDFQLNGVNNTDAVETFQFLTRTSLGAILLKETPLLSEPSTAPSAAPQSMTEGTPEESTPESDPVSAALKRIGLSRALYYEDSRVHTFNPPFDIDLISLFRLPEPTGAARQVVLWLEYINPLDNFPESRYITFPVALSRGGTFKLEQIGGSPTLRRAAIVHSPNPDVTCRLYFDGGPRAENEGVAFTPTSPFEGPLELLLGVVCY